MKAKTTVTADLMISRNNPKQLYFSGNVKAVQEGVTLTSKELITHYGPKGKGVVKISVNKNVEIKSATRTITGGHADLFPGEKKIIITNNASVVQEGEDLKGEKIIYFYDRDDIIITGDSNNRAKLLLTPEGN